MSKKRRTVSLEPQVNDYLSREGINASELVNKLVKQHMNGGASEDQILEFRIEQVESQLNEIESDRKLKKKELQQLENRRQNLSEQKQEQKQSQLEEARESLKGTPKVADNPAVENWAEKLDMSPEELIEELGDDNE